MQNKTKYKKISIIIPVFNEEKYIKNVIEKVTEALVYGLKKEIIIVDDGSTDNTKIILKNLDEKMPISLIFLDKNCGKGEALKNGFIKSTGDIVIVQDADLEYDPSDYPRLINPFLRQDADVVFGSRLSTSEAHRVLYYWHSVGNRILTLFSNMFTNLNLTDMETGYKLFKGDLIRDLAPNLKSKRFGFEPEIVAKVAKRKKLKIYEVGISYSGRTYQEGKKIGFIDGIRAFWEIVKFNLLEKN